MIGLWPTLAWFVSLLVLTALFGFIIALMLFFLAFLTLRARKQGETLRAREQGESRLRGAEPRSQREHGVPVAS